MRCTPLATVFAAAAAFAASGCFTRAPPVSVPGYPLYVDLSKIVTSRNRTGWAIDEREIEEASWNALNSVCRTTEVVRSDLLAWLDQAIAELGGPVEEAYVARGRKRRKVREVLELTRIRMLLARAMDRAHECPFWIEPDEDFAGIHGEAKRITLMFESNGSVSFVPRPDGTTTFAGGGSARLLAGWGFGQFFTLNLGGEGGGAGTFRPGAMAGGTRELVPRFFLMLPLVARFHYYSYSADLEVGVGWQFFEYDFVLRPGYRAAFTIGANVLRVGGLMPYGNIGLSVERFRLFDGSWETYLGGLYRVGFNFDPWNR